MDDRLVDHGIPASVVWTVPEIAARLAVLERDLDLAIVQGAAQPFAGIERDLIGRLALQGIDEGEESHATLPVSVGSQSGE